MHTFYKSFIISLYPCVVNPVLAAFTITMLAGPLLIRLLRRLRVMQVEREDGVEAHLAKRGTPTMGGLMFLLACVLTSLFYMKKYPAVWPVVFLMLAFGMIGCLDDLLKILGRKPEGLSVMGKLVCQVIVTAVYAAYVTHVSPELLVMRIPWGQGRMLELGWLSIPLLFLVVLGTVNGVNLTDGVDGLASSVTLIVSVYLLVDSVGQRAGLEPVASAVIGGLLGFLIFNAYPARVFMGDTGSLALGGFLVGMVYQLQIPLYLPLVGIVYVVESFSVILQVGYFKRAHGKRLFLMTPLHHHLELKGWSETRVVAVFSVVTAIACFVAIGG